LLFRASAKRLGLDLRRSRAASGVTASAARRRSTRPSSTSSSWGAWRCATCSFASRARRPGEGFDLLLGEDFLSSFDIEFDLANDVVRLWQPKDCDGARSRIGRRTSSEKSRSKR
jgi:hypothetical protein